MLRRALACGALLLALMQSALAEPPPRPIVFVPLDDRPVTFQLPVMLARIAGRRVVVPPRSMVGNYLQFGRPRRTQPLAVRSGNCGCERVRSFSRHAQLRRPRRVAHARDGIGHRQRPAPRSREVTGGAPGRVYRRLRNDHAAGTDRTSRERSDARSVGDRRDRRSDPSLREPARPAADARRDRQSPAAARAHRCTRA